MMALAPLWACMAAAPLVWVPGPVDADLAAALRGQLSDLSWRLEWAPQAEVEDAPQRAGAVLWFTPLPDEGVRVHLTVPDRRWRRDIRALSPVATAEAAALVVRSALLAIEEGVAPDWSLAPPPPSAWGWSVAGRGEMTGVGANGGLAAVGFRRWGPWTAGLESTARWPTTVRRTDADLRVGRYDLIARGGRSLYAASSWHLELNAGLGAGLWFRETARAGSDVDATPTRWLASGVARLGLSAQARLSASWIMTVGVGADGLLGTPEWSIDGEPPLASPWPVQPWISVGFGVDPSFVSSR